MLMMLKHWAEAYILQRKTEKLVRRLVEKYTLIKLSTWSCLHIRMQNEINIETDNNSFESVEWIKYFRNPLTNQNSIQEEIKSRMKSGNACYHSVQNLLSSSLLPKNIYTD